ncbi:MAG: winged helix-turn-helix domain-containing protein [Algicola sp.]|nr:winged helix-turn-helix domain-containing protein [Algicola sp.]
MDNFKLKNWIVDVKSRQLRAQGQELRTTELPKLVMDVLIYFTQHPGEVVNNEQLAKALLPDVEKAEDEVAQAVQKLVDVFGDTTADNQVIEPLGDRGYRLVATPQPVIRSTDSPSPVTATSFALKNKKKHGAKHAYGSLGLVVLVAFFGLIIGFVGLSIYKQTPVYSSNVNSGAKQRGDVSLLAVLPFRNISGDNTFNYISDGLTEEIINSLSNRTSTDIIASTTSFNYANKINNTFRIGRALNATYVLTGNVKRSKDRLKITVHLTSTIQQTTIWTHTYERQYEDLVAIKSAIVFDVTKQLNLPGKKPAKIANRIGQGNIEAYDAYMQGLDHSKQITASSLKKAVQLFQQAINKDSQFAQAYVGLADTLLLQMRHGFLPQQGAANMAKQALDKALQISPNLAHAYASYGLLRANTGQQLAAIVLYQKAIKLKPNDAAAQLGLGILRHNRLELNQAKKVLSRALKLDPEQPSVNRYVGLNLLAMGELENGIKYLTQSIDSTSETVDIELELARWYNHYGKRDKTNQWAKVAYGKAPEHHLAAIAMAFGASDKTSMHHWLEKARMLDPDEQVNFLPNVNLFYYQGDSDSLSQYVNRILFTDAGQLDTSKPVLWQLWAGIGKINEQDYQQAVRLLEIALIHYKAPTSSPLEQLQLVNQLAFAYSKLSDNDNMTKQLGRSKDIQRHLLSHGVRTPFLVAHMVAYYTLMGEQNKAEQLLQNARLRGWNLNRYITSNPIFELLPSRASYIGV